MNGYQHQRYADSLAEFGTPRALPRSRGWVLQRQIPGTRLHDAIGCYPLFACQDWSSLDTDLRNIGTELVSLSVVTDPFGEYDEDYLHRCFRHVVRPFKEHYIVDLDRPVSSFVSAHHRRNIRKALRVVTVERLHNPLQFSDEWVALYAALIDRHHIKGIPAFSRFSLTSQLQVPGGVVFRARFKETTIGMIVWYVNEEVGYYHLGASSDLGYKLRASFALFWSSIDYFASIGLRWLSLGAGPGLKDNSANGLNRFKRGWSTGTRTAYFCGRIFDEENYTELVRSRGISSTDYFPAYRKGEFA